MTSTFNAETADNFEDIEKQFAVKTVMYMQTHFSLLESRKGSELKLTKIDDEIYEHFKETFPEIDVSQKLDEGAMKSKEGKAKWREFINQYEKKVADFNFGTMLRDSPKADYDQHTTIFAVRMQFYAIEIARNKLGLNDWIYEEAQKQKS
ncbi:hypothetical protein H072_3817 [Dactylellina haptotyla CBS 200.50]|uniref:Protein PBDC1 homolog n=1 Tax=Dactylellina haptotyla (strain CBS 200.50) TaxID=1284197 RepID=S8C3B3_DACHA|nr:hypothetical protein H072_3817 [Dactylellina haptotyla CBS 200.50]